MRRLWFVSVKQLLPTEKKSEELSSYQRVEVDILNQGEKLIF